MESNSLQSVVATPTCYSQDIRNLIQEYVQKKTTSFAEFRKTWKELYFSRIHECKPSGVSDVDFLQYLFSLLLGFFFVNKSFNVRLSIFYSLYVLHETQHNTPKTKIVVSMALWHEIIHFIMQVKDARLAEPYQIYLTMLRKQHFCFSALPPANEYFRMVETKEGEADAEAIPPLSDVVNIDTVTGLLDVDLIAHISTLYGNAKTQALEGSHPPSSATSTSSLSSSLRSSSDNLVSSAASRNRSLNVWNSGLSLELAEMINLHNREKMFRSLAGTVGLQAPTETKLLQRPPAQQIIRQSVRDRDYSNITPARSRLSGSVLSPTALTASSSRPSLSSVASRPSVSAVSSTPLSSRSNATSTGKRKAPGTSDSRPASALSSSTSSTSTSVSSSRSTSFVSQPSAPWVYPASPPPISPLSPPPRIESMPDLLRKKMPHPRTFPSPPATQLSASVAPIVGSNGPSSTTATATSSLPSSRSFPSSSSSLNNTASAPSSSIFSSSASQGKEPWALSAAKILPTPAGGRRPSEPRRSSGTTTIPPLTSATSAVSSLTFSVRTSSLSSLSTLGPTEASENTSAPRRSLRRSGQAIAPMGSTSPTSTTVLAPSSSPSAPSQPVPSPSSSRKRTNAATKESEEPQNELIARPRKKRSM